MFMHASWMHIIGNMIYPVGFRPRDRRRDGQLARFLVFYLAGGIVAMMAQVLGVPYLASQASAPAEPSPR